MNIGFIGLGIMGESMCENIIRKHDGKVYVYDFIESQVRKLSDLGAVACENAREVADKADVLISMVPKSEHSRSLYMEILPHLNEGKICIDMSTIDPSVSVDIAEKVSETGAEFADAPVVKSKPAAISGTLGIYVGSSEKTFETIRPILEYMGSNIIRMGENGKGLIMKICHNTLVAQIQNGVNETIALAAKNGIGVDAYAKAISYGGGQNFYLDGKAKAIADGNYATAFSVENMAKDLGICQVLAKESEVSMPGLEVSSKVYADALESGYAKEDFSATYKVVARVLEEV